MKLCDYIEDGQNALLGWLYYDNQGENKRTCLLRQNEERMELIIPFKPVNDDFSAWFLSNSNQDPNNGFGKNIPKQLWVHDVMSKAVYCLVNPRLLSIENVSGDNGYGVLSFEYCVKRKHVINSILFENMRSYIPEFNIWACFSQSDIEESPSCDVETFNIDDGITFKFNHIEKHECRKGIEPYELITNHTVFETASENDLSFNDHLLYHKDVKSLLSIIAWRNVSFKNIWVRDCREERSPIDDLLENAIYNELITDQFDDWEYPKDSPPFLFTIRDIGLMGVAEWFALVSEYRDPLENIIYIAQYHQYLTAQAQILQFGASFEILGTLITGKKDTGNQKISIHDRVASIVTDAETRLKSSLFEDKEFVIENITQTYNAIKHSNEKRKQKRREEWLAPNNLLMVVIYCRAIAIAWIGGRLGCSNILVDKIKKDLVKLIDAYSLNS